MTALVARLESVERVRAAGESTGRDVKWKRREAGREFDYQDPTRGKSQVYTRPLEPSRRTESISANSFDLGSALTLSSDLFNLKEFPNSPLLPYTTSYDNLFQFHDFDFFRG